MSIHMLSTQNTNNKFDVSSIDNLQYENYLHGDFFLIELLQEGVESLSTKEEKEVKLGQHWWYVDMVSSWDIGIW